MTFYLIHPTIINLYVNVLTLHILEEELGKIGPGGLTQETQNRIDHATNEYVLSAREAEKFFSPFSIRAQINAFDSHEGIA